MRSIFSCKQIEVEVKPIVLTIGFLVKITNPETGEQDEIFIKQGIATVKEEKFKEEFEESLF